MHAVCDRIHNSIVENTTRPHNFLRPPIPGRNPSNRSRETHQRLFQKPQKFPHVNQSTPLKDSFLTAVHTIPLHRQSSHHRRRSTQPSPLLRPRSKHRLRRLNTPLLPLPPCRPRNRPLQNLYRVLPRPDSGCARGLRPCAA